MSQTSDRADGTIIASNFLDRCAATEPDRAIRRKFVDAARALRTVGHDVFEERDANRDYTSTQLALHADLVNGTL